MDGTITAQLSIGTPAQTVDVQLDTGSQKLMGIHQSLGESRRLACFVSFLWLGKRRMTRRIYRLFEVGDDHVWR